MSSIVTRVDLDSDGVGISRVTICVSNPSTELMRTLVLGEPLNTGGNVTSEESASVLSKEYYTQRVAHGTLKPQKSIFSALSDKEALRTMADECARRGLSIMVGMKVQAIKKRLFVKYQGNEGIARSNHLEIDGGVIYSPWSPSQPTTNPDEAFAKIMKTIKDYQDRIKS